MLRSIRWKRHWKLVLALVAGFLVLTFGFGGARISAITSSERHATDAFISTDIPGRVALFDDTQVHAVELRYGILLEIALKVWNGTPLDVRMGYVNVIWQADANAIGLRMLFLGKSSRAPARALIQAGVPVALATDFNPGTSPTPNFALILTLGVSQLGMSVAEAMIAGTVNGAAALALADRVGQLAPGFSADLALFDVCDVRELPYWYGDRRCLGTWVRGKSCHPSHLRVS